MRSDICQRNSTWALLGAMCKNSCHDYIYIVSGKEHWGLFNRGSVQIQAVQVEWKCNVLRIHCSSCMLIGPLIYCAEDACSFLIIWHHPHDAQGWISHRQAGGNDGDQFKRSVRRVRGRRSESKWKRGGVRGDENTNHNDRDSLPTVAHSIHYAWKCDTFPPQWMALTLKPIPSTSAGCSPQSVIEFFRKSIGWCKGTALPLWGGKTTTNTERSCACY